MQDEVGAPEVRQECGGQGLREVRHVGVRQDDRAHGAQQREVAGPRAEGKYGADERPDVLGPEEGGGAMLGGIISTTLIVILLIIVAVIAIIAAIVRRVTR